MCGICGQINWGLPEPKAGQILSDMNLAIRHRGPDDEGFYQDSFSQPNAIQGTVGLAMRRLSIIDVSGGKQPITNETGDVVIVFNGEIYNFSDLRSQLEALGHTFKTKSDTEVIVHGYEVWGDDVAAKLNGMFAYAIWDKRKDRLVLARDHMGIKPLYYARLKDKIVFGSEIKSVLKDPSVPKDVDPLAVDDYLSLRYIPAPRSIYKSIRKLEPATLLIWEQGQMTIKPYWNFIPSEHVDRGLDYYLQKLDGLLSEAVQRQLVSEVPLGTFLSGGLDSPTIAWYARQSKPDLLTFTMYFEDQSFSEREEALMVAKHLGTQHVEQLVRPQVEDIVPALVDIFDEPFGDDSMIPTYFLTKMARERMTVALSGDGGDELFGGYRTYLADRVAPYYRLIPRIFRERLLEPVINGPLAAVASRLTPSALAFAKSAGQRSPLEHFGWTELFKEETKRSLRSPLLASQIGNHRSSESFEKAYADSFGRSGLEKFLYVDQKTHLPDEFLVKVDRLSMAHSLEVRPPFLDVKLVEFAAELPMHYKIRGLTTKWLVRKLMQGRLPASILKGKKRGFGSPMASWISGPLLPFIKDQFQPHKLKSNPYLNPTEPERLLKLYLSGRKDLARRLWSLLMLTTWFNQKGQ